MKFGFKTALTAAIALSLSACVSTSTSEQLTEASQGELRSAQAQARDQYRHPVETLTFFGIEPNMTVVEVSPGGGWYTDILAPLLKGKGTLYAAHFPADSDVKYYQRSLAGFKEKMANTRAYADIRLTEFHPGTHHNIAPEGSADMVLTFRNLHNWYMNADEQGVKDAMRAFYTALKPGGVLGVVDHRLPETRDSGKAKRSGYVKESWVIALAQEAGFELVAKSEINANPKDFANHPKGVWTLPPSLSLGEEDRAKYEAIGESDRMTLKFIKPL